MMHAHLPWKRAALGIAAAVALVLMPLAAEALGTLDQQQPNDPQGINVRPSLSLAQIFTAGRTGRLDQVDLSISQISATAPVTVELRNVRENGTPGARVLTSGSLAVGVAQDYPAHGFVTIQFSPKAAVVAGTRYAIVLYSEGTYRWHGQSGDPYPAGREFSSADSSPPTNWGPPTDGDAAFKTYVWPSCDGLMSTLVGTEGDDVLTGTSGVDVIAGLGGNDTITGLDGDDVVCGGAGDDTIKSGVGADRVRGGAGNDNVAGGKGKDNLSGGSNDDDLNGGAGVDNVAGSSGDDTLAGGLGAPDTCDGGSGTDTAAVDCEIQEQVP